MRGLWDPLVTTEEFERGLQILAKRTEHRIAKRKHDYFLKNMLYIQIAPDQKPIKLTGSKSNTSRPGGGTSYYCIPHSNINIPCHIVDNAIENIVLGFQVRESLLPMIKDAYTSELAQKLALLRPSEEQSLVKTLKSIDEEEARTARLFATGKISDRVWDNLWLEWQDRRRTIEAQLSALQHKKEYHIANLDTALTILSKIGVLYKKLGRDDKKDLLRLLVERIIVDSEGMIHAVELWTPFAYLDQIRQWEKANQENHAVTEKTKTHLSVGQCSDYILLGDPNGLRAVS